jgi:hypothetical protein
MASLNPLRVSVRPAAGTATRREPLTFGVPLPAGRVAQPDRLVAVAGGALATDVRVLDRWPDGSARWALVDTDVDVPPRGLHLELRDDLPRPPGSTLTAVVTGRSAEVAGADWRVVIDAGDPRVFTSITCGGVDALVCPGPVVQAVDRTGAIRAAAFSAVEVEHQGARRVVLRVLGRVVLDGGAALDVRLRLTLLADHPGLGIEVGLHNPRPAQHPGGFWMLGDPGSVFVRAVSFTCAVPAAPRAAWLSIDPDAPAARVALPVAVAQHASGGANWQSRVHVNRDGVVPLTRPGGTVTANGETRAAARLSPWLALDHASGRVAVAGPRFWEVFPKAIEADPSGALTVWTLPAGDDLHEIQGGERCDHEFRIAVGAAGDDALLAWARTPSTVLPDVALLAEAERFPALGPVEPGVNPVYERLVDAAVEGGDTFLAKRERIDEYGWRHFGDLYADHENGPDPARQIVSHYNNQYDAVLGLTLQAVRHADHRWWRLAGDLARHVVRSDIYWTDGDRAAYNGGLFWHSAHYIDAGTSTHRTYPRVEGLDGGGPSNEHCYAHGLLLHYYLTGDGMSRDAVVRLADWCLAIDDGRLARFPLPWLSTAPTGGASSTAAEDYHGPGRGPANVILTLLHAWRLTGDARYGDAAEALVRRVIHPQDDLDARRLDFIEGRWSYTVFLQALGRYLALFEARGRDGRWEYVRACVLHYARWMAEHEYFYLDRPEKLEFPNETWAAQELRKAEVLDLAAFHAATAEERDRFLAVARHFHDRALETLAASPVHSRTRPVVVLMSTGYARPWFERHAAAVPVRPVPDTWPPPVVFERQKVVALRRMKQAAAAAAVTAAAGAALLVRWLLG